MKEGVLSMGRGKVNNMPRAKRQRRVIFFYHIADVWHKSVAARFPVIISCCQQLSGSWDRVTTFTWCCNLMWSYHNSFKDLQHNSQGDTGRFHSWSHEHLTLVPRCSCCGKMAALSWRVSCCMYCLADSRCSAEGSTSYLVHMYFLWRKNSWKRDRKVNMSGYFCFSMETMGLCTVKLDININ